jgi:hypothetical protein
MTDIQDMDANQLIAEIRFNKLVDDYFDQPLESRYLAQLEDYLEQNPEDHLVDERNKNYVTMTLQVPHMCARRTAVPVKALPRFMQSEIKQVSEDSRKAQPVQTAPKPVFTKRAYA